MASTSVFRKESPRLDGTNYGIWKIRMEIHLKCISKEVWEVTKTPFVNEASNSNLDKDLENDCRAREALFSTLSDQ